MPRRRMWVRCLETAIDPRDERASVDRLLVAFLSGARRLPSAEVLVELSELVAEPEQAHALVELRILEFFLDMKLDGVGAPVRQSAVGFDGARFRGSSDHEEVAGPFAIEPAILEDLLRPRVEVFFAGVEQDDGASLLQRSEKLVEILAADRGEGLDVGRLAPAARLSLGEPARMQDTLEHLFEAGRAVRFLRLGSDRDFRFLGRRRRETLSRRSLGRVDGEHERTEAEDSGSDAEDGRRARASRIALRTAIAGLTVDHLTTSGASWPSV